MVKGDGDAIGITEDEGALRRWIAGPEIARMLNEYDAKYSIKRNECDHHHEQIPNIQKAFASDVRSVIEEKKKNSFTEDSTDLLTLNMKVIMSEDVVQSIRKAVSNVCRGTYY